MCYIPLEEQVLEEILLLLRRSSIPSLHTLQVKFLKKSLFCELRHVILVISYYHISLNESYEAEVYVHVRGTKVSGFAS